MLVYVQRQAPHRSYCFDAEADPNSNDRLSRVEQVRRVEDRGNPTNPAPEGGHNTRGGEKEQKTNTERRRENEICLVAVEISDFRVRGTGQAKTVRRKGRITRSTTVCRSKSTCMPRLRQSVLSMLAPLPLLPPPPPSPPRAPCGIEHATGWSDSWR